MFPSNANLVSIFIASWRFLPEFVVQWRRAKLFSICKQARYINLDLIISDGVNFLHKYAQSWAAKRLILSSSEMINYFPFLIYIFDIFSAVYCVGRENKRSQRENHENRFPFIRQKSLKIESAISGSCRCEENPTLFSMETIPLFANDAMARCGQELQNHPQLMGFQLLGR